MIMKLIVLLTSHLFVLQLFLVKIQATSCNVETAKRINCYPETGPTVQDKCNARGCCFDFRLYLNDEIPQCFYPSDYPTYKVDNLTKTTTGYSAVLSINSTQHHPFGPMLQTVSLDIYMEKEHRLRFRLTDPNNHRYEVPISLQYTAKQTVDHTLYNLTINRDRFGLILTRKSSGIVIFNSTIAPLFYADQFLQISTSLPSTYLYGLGERHASTLISTDWERNVFWNHDGHPTAGVNLYGDHPFYMCIENDGNSHGVFFVNSNAKEVVTQPAPALTWRSVGGIFDFYVFLGPTPEMVAQQYAEVVTPTFLPPMWSLGFHLCRYGYDSAKTTQSFVDRMRNASIPQDVQWNDIDYMINHLDFTYDPITYKTLPQVVENLHQHDQHYVMIIDPGIANQQPNGTYPAYEDGIASGIFIMDPENKEPIEGKVWPGFTVFPDFNNPFVTDYWEKQLRAYHEEIPFDGVWIDMNEPSNMVYGSTSGCPNNNLESPPYTPKIAGGTLSTRTLCVSALQYSAREFYDPRQGQQEKKRFSNTEYHYNLHSLTGLLEMKATNQALKRIRNKRPFIISRSTFSSAGQYGGHWNGDISSTWADMKQSIATVINFNIFAIPMVGADICGFGEDTTEELCTRWMQLGAFYPFSRNHNSLHSKGQAPVEFSEIAQKNMRDILLVRYSYLPFLYSLFVSSHLTGSTVARGLFFEFPLDKTALSIDEQFMWGSGLMISPVLEEGATGLRMYYPAGLWYFVYGPFGKKVESSGEWYNYFNVKLSDVFLHARGGSILPAQYPNTTMTETRKNPVYLIVAPDQMGNAEGFLFWDDGDSIDSYITKTYLNVKFNLKNNVLVSNVITSHEKIDLILTNIWLLNASPDITYVYLNGNTIKFDRRAYDVLHLSCSIGLSKAFEVQYK